MKNSKEMQTLNESGRSMVEMLGVLAVIGVLSVAGIAGYTAAMKKHRVNEILNEATKRAVLVAAQAMTGKTGEISLGEFTQNTFSGVTFADKANVADNKITLGLSGSALVDICPQLKNATGDDTAIKVTKDDCSELTFNVDMSKGSGNTEPDPCTGVTCTAEGEVCDNGFCVKACTGNNCQWCYSDSNWNRQCKNSTGCQKNSDCVGKSVDGTECASGDCYCAISATQNSNGNENTAYWTSFTGVCARLSANEKNSSQKHSDNVMSWWSAKNFCKAKGSNMVSTTDVCDNSGCTSTPDYYWLQECWCPDPSCTCNDNSHNTFFVLGGYVSGNSRDNPTYAVCK